ncbi:transposase [Marinitoga aeolica]|uniref:Transposase n=1 Tax=Marinitoga aeolica TaxID=2809031 RepID=A0ABY8PPV9_9BACT|nr:transposase [Marinitoga aeolica]
MIIEYNVAHDGRLGYRRMTMYINRYNHMNYSEKYIHRLMKYLKIKSRIRKKKINRKRSNNYTKENILNRNFKSNKLYFVY